MEDVVYCMVEIHLCRGRDRFPEQLETFGEEM